MTTSKTDKCLLMNIIVKVHDKMAEDVQIESLCLKRNYSCMQKLSIQVHLKGCF